MNKQRKGQVTLRQAQIWKARGSRLKAKGDAMKTICFFRLISIHLEKVP